VKKTVVIGINLTDIERFKNFFHCWILQFAGRFLLYFPPHLKHVATLLRETSAVDTFEFQQWCLWACPRWGKRT